MNPVDTFLKKFEYKKRIPFITGWRYIGPPDRPAGVCTDFAWTMAWLEAGSFLKLLWNLITFKMVFWLVHSKENKILPRHVVLYYRGKGWIDSTFPFWRDKLYHTKVLPLFWPWALFRAAWGGLF